MSSISGPSFPAPAHLISGVLPPPRARYRVMPSNQQTIQIGHVFKGAVSIIPPCISSRGDLGRSPDANAIYDQYLSFYALIDDYTDAINAKYPTPPQPANVVADLATLAALKTGPLAQAYQADYANASKTIRDFWSDCASTMEQALAAYNDAMGIGPTPPTPIPPAPTPHDRIVKDLAGAQSLVSTLNNTITTFSQNIVALNNLLSNARSLLQSLTARADALPDGAKKTKALADIAIANADLLTLTANIATANNSLDALQTLVSSYTASGGPIDQLTTLAGESNPTLTDATTADTILQTMASGSLVDQTTAQNDITTASNQAGKVTKDVAQVQTDLDLTPLPPIGIGVEGAVWYLDWNYWFPVGSPQVQFPLPSYSQLSPGATPTLNLFVGMLTTDGSGNPAIGGFGDITTAAQLNELVRQCKAHTPPLNVKITIGGHGGSSDHDNCWDLLTSGNVSTFAQALVNFCKTYNLDGVDFDYEEIIDNSKPTRDVLVGQLIKTFKQLGRDQLGKEPMTSLCTMAGFGDNYPWQAHMQSVMDASVDATTGKCGVDRLYIMSYDQSYEKETNWIEGWAGWAASRYGFNFSQITVGIAPAFGTYDPQKMLQFAIDNGYSYSLWDFDPGHPPFSAPLPSAPPERRDELRGTSGVRSAPLPIAPPEKRDELRGSSGVPSRPITTRRIPQEIQGLPHPLH